MTRKNMKTRIKRLENLCQGFCQEFREWQSCDGLLLPKERRQYLNGIQDAIAGLDEGRVILSNVLTPDRRHPASGPQFGPVRD